MDMFGKRSILRPALAASLSLSFTVVSHATTYAQATDFEVTSPNSAYRFIADHPDWNTDPGKAPYLIAYTLIDARTGETRWTRRGMYNQLISETWPGNAYGAYVGNHGNVLLYGPEKGVFTPLGASDGATGPRMGLGVGRLGYRRRFTFWAKIEIDDESYLLIRSQRGKRKLIRFAPIEIITDLTEQQDKACETIERAYALSTLENACERLDVANNHELFTEILPAPPQTPEPQPSLLKVVYAIRTALQMAGISGYQDAVPALQKLEQWRPTIPDNPDVDPYQRYLIENYNLALWRASKHALHRLGFIPTDAQPVSFSYSGALDYPLPGNDRASIPVALQKTRLITIDMVESIHPGMPLHEVFVILGAPDAEDQYNRRFRRYEFDIDADPPFTFRIESAKTLVEREPPVVTAVERITPPRWTIEAGRELDRDWAY